MRLLGFSVRTACRLYAFHGVCGHCQALWKRGRMAKHTVATAATFSCIERLRGQRPPCRLHLQLSFYRVGAAEVKAAQQARQFPPQVLSVNTQLYTCVMTRILLMRAIHVVVNE